jgi:ABC-type transporter Mla subunit MlaD
LGEVAFVIEDFAASLRRRQAGIDERFRQEIILDAFTYVNPQSHGFTLEPSEEMFRVFGEKRRAITQALADLDLASDEFEKRSDEFFGTIEELMSTIRRLADQRDKEGELPKELTEAVTAWFMNQSQVDRIDRLFEATNKYREEQAEAYKPLHDFIELTNKFFGQTGKDVQIDRAGDVQIRMKDKTSSLNALSSGERQILIMLAHLSLNRRLLKDGVFIVDEPELSLQWLGKTCL